MAALPERLRQHQDMSQLPILSIDLKRAGWGTFCLSGHQGVFENRMSNVLVDTVGDLISATCSALTGEEDDFCLFDEPGTFWLWLLPMGEQVSVDVYYDSCHPLGEPARDEMRPICRLVFETLDFAASVVAAVTRLYDLYGEDEYKKLWRYDFPLSKLRELKALVSRHAR